MKKVKTTKGSTTKPLPAAGAKPAESALVGGVSNRTERVDYKKGK